MAKFTFSASVQLKELLDQCAALFETVYGSKDKTEDLIPVMLEGFIKSDVHFRKLRKEKGLLQNPHPRDQI